MMTRITALRGWMDSKGLDGFLLTTADAHQGEDPPDHNRALRWLTGFSGSLANAVVTADRAVLFVDGRYLVQAAQQLDRSVWEIAHLHDYPPSRWLAENAVGSRIGFDPMLWTVAQARTLPGLIAADDPFVAIWPDRPAPPLGPVREMPEMLAGETGAAKRARLRAALAGAGVDLWVETRPDDIAWTLNLRGSDVPMHPVPLSFALFPAAGPVEWFIAPEKLSGIALPPDVVAQRTGGLIERLAALAAGARVGLDPVFAPEALGAVIRAAGGTVVEMADPITAMKALKTPAELAGYREAHIADGAAWVEFLAWLSTEVPKRAVAGKPISESEAAARIGAFRHAQPGYLEPSFTAIAAAGSNAAMCHYAPVPGEDAPILPDRLFLLDSGGQYRGGTTDATRTVAFGPVPAHIRVAATAVLRGFLALSMARFPVGTFPHQLDALARVPLWALALDYDHGTGHGVGHNLLVHEHPHRFGKRANPFPLEPGNVMTIEPGYYAEGEFGLRIENQVEVVADGAGFAMFRPLTLVPIDLSLFELAGFTEAELHWIDAYHARVWEVLEPCLSKATRIWLRAATEAVSPGADRNWRVDK